MPTDPLAQPDAFSADDVLSMTHQPEFPNPTIDETNRRLKLTGQNLWDTWIAPAKRLGEATTSGTLDVTDPATAGDALGLVGSVTSARAPFAEAGAIGSMGGKATQARGGVLADRPNAETLKKLKDSGLTAKEIADVYGMSRQSLNYYMKQGNLTKAIKKPFDDTPDWFKEEMSNTEPLKRDVIERGRSGRPTATKPFPTGTDDKILEEGLRRYLVTSPEGKQYVIAYHGSPHDFDKFDISRIGTGEGAQAYGHGLYFAENEGAAKYYRDTISQNQGTPVQELMSQALQGRSREDAIKGLRETAESLKDSPEPRSYKPRYNAADYAEAANRLEQGEQHGRMYQVSIKADPEHFLDWDKPLSEQSEHVRQRLKDFGIEGHQNILNAVDDLAMRLGQEADFEVDGQTLATRALAKAGIPGIKYLDQGSRNLSADVTRIERALENARKYQPKDVPEIQQELAAAKQRHDSGSRNYVVFDDKMIGILKKYGWASLGLPAMGGANDPEKN
jgi:hypothetical protein